MKRDGLRLANPIPVEGMVPMTFSCIFTTEGVSPHELDDMLHECPHALAEFWVKTRTAKLFEDQVYGQWGVVILDPTEATATTQKCQEQRRRDFIVGDLVIGKFLGDSDLLVIRNDPTASDFGNVLVALPIDPRSEWYRVADSFGMFLESYITAAGDKYWTAG